MASSDSQNPHPNEWRALGAAVLRVKREGLVWDSG
jgi:hypothetical protein